MCRKTGVDRKVSNIIEDVKRQEIYTVRMILNSADRALDEDKSLATKTAEAYINLASMVLRNLNSYESEMRKLDI